MIGVEKGRPEKAASPKTNPNNVDPHIEPDPNEASKGLGPDRHTKAETKLPSDGPTDVVP
ncbi:MAG: hypothetical protein H0Z39_11380 [Peptococcaceae bacterium]|nr:hypothetical protein [Peptococcaceae bacterium]